MATLSEILQAGYAHHQAGRLQQAQELYRQVLAAEPNHADTWHLLGLVAYQGGRPDTAAELIGKAIQLDGNRAMFHCNLGSVLYAANQLVRAEAALERALQIDPRLPDAYNHLGNVRLKRGDGTGAMAAYRRALDINPDYDDANNNLAAQLHSRGELDEAIEYYRRAIRINPRHIDAHNNLSTALLEQGKPDEAAQVCSAAVELAPQVPKGHINLGNARKAQGQLEDAAACYRKALQLDPRSALAWNNLGAVRKEQGRFDEAATACRQAIELDPRLPDAHYNLGSVHHSGGEWAAAANCYRAALDRNPHFLPALLHLGRLLDSRGELAEAAALFDRALRTDSRSAMAHLYRGEVYERQGRPDQALNCYRQAIALKPDYPEAYNMLARMYCDRGLPDQAIEYCQRGLQHDPDAAALHANLSTALSFQGRQAESIDAARRAVELRPGHHEEYSNLLYSLNFLPDYDPQRLFEEHLEWARRHAEPLTAAAPPLTNDRTPDRRLRVGYVSPYFREHAVNFFTEPLVTSHDHEVVETFFYSDNRRDDDATARLRAAADHWRDVRYRSDAELAGIVREDRIDVLVDLTGHIALHRLLTFARRPAPVQVTYIGYQNTTGMSAMDYRLTDEWADPPGTDHFYTERLYRLPRSYFCYRPADDAPAVTPLPASESGRITFGSFNNFSKVTPLVIDTWLEILRRVPNSRLLVLANQGGYVERHVSDRARAAEVDPRRIELFNRMPRDKYYELITRADIALDPFPFNGHTTACDCVWLGLPVLMLAGETYASRFGGGVLAPLGLERLIARSPLEYIERAVELAANVPELVRLRQSLRATMKASVLLDFPGFARDVETAYRQMWIRWCGQS